MNVANPSFQSISFRSRRWRFRLRTCIDSPSESGVSNLYGLITDLTKENFDEGGDGGGGESESESRGQYCVVGVRRLVGGRSVEEEEGGQVQSVRTLERISRLAS